MTDTPPSSDQHDAPDWETLARYLAGESPAGEGRVVAAWLAAHPGDAAVLAGLDAAMARLSGSGASTAGTASDDAIDVEGALRRVQARRDAEPEGVLPFRRPEPRPVSARRTVPAAGWRRHWRAGGLAAAAAVAALAVGLWRRDTAPTDDRRPADMPVVAGRTFTTGVGARDSVRLPDGSRVVLAPGSRLTVAADYAATVGRRDVTLEGAAWFAVDHDEARPFTVRAGGAIVRDLGTEFVVRTDGVDGTGGVSVAVTEGSVALTPSDAAAGAPSTRTAGDTGVVLAAGDRGELRANGRVVAVRGGVTDDDVAWTRGRLVYRAAPLEVVRADLRRWYGVELRLADSALAGRRLTAEFEGDSVGAVLNVIALALGVEVERAGATATLRPR